jgi:hypothetical protein
MIPAHHKLPARPLGARKALRGAIAIIRIPC